MNALNWIPLALVLVLQPPPARALDTNAVQSAVRAVIVQQEKDWNDGEIEKFMRGYLRSVHTRFASGGNVTLGWQAVLERYQRTYPDKTAMGRLTFSDLDISALSEDGAVAFGRWHLRREKDELTGLFTLLFRKTTDGWRIVHDHTSAADKK
jgi:ketosteroid isomerase-like protein